MLVETDNNFQKLLCLIGITFPSKTYLAWMVARAFEIEPREVMSLSKGQPSPKLHMILKAGGDSTQVILESTNAKQQTIEFSLR